ncbi:MAG: cyclic nucleotide-binding domain-containing protein [Planctomycetales bacterium]|nr:cyclic nucleotide-binding domain-containing protein [Planctomycetales bacterium]
MNAQSLAPLLHVANVLYFFSYSVRDILWLRALTVAGMTLCLPYYGMRATPEWPPIFWHVVFIAVNLFQIGWLLKERMPIELNVDEAMLHVGPLRMMSPQQVRKIVRQGVWRKASPGERIVEEGQQLNRLILIHSGEVDVRSSGDAVARLTGGQFVGEMSYLTGKPTTADVLATGPVLYLEWTDKQINHQLDTDLFLALQSAIGIDLVEKLQRMREAER